MTHFTRDLSKDDELQGESNSIFNQKAMLEAYARQNGLLNYRFFVDASDIKSKSKIPIAMKLLIKQNEDGGKKRSNAKLKELDAAEKRITELSAISKRLYEDSVSGRITDERFMEMSADCEAEQEN